MKILINGETVQVPDECTVSDLLNQHGLSGSPCAVEVNRELIPKREHEARLLFQGDRVEVVTLVGGG
jgi:sulfur carrier protein